MADEQKTLIDVTALKYFYKSLQNVAVLIAPSTIDEASSENLGRTYLIPADGTYAGIECKMGDHIVSNGISWFLIPKGTEGTTADKITYDNTETGFPATNVQEAVDDLVGNLRTKLDSPINYTKVGAFLTATSVDSLGAVNEVKWQDVELDVGVTDIKFGDDGESQTGTVIINAESIGLENVDNTSDMDKPISTATQGALDDKADAQHNHSAEDVISMKGYDGEPYSSGSEYVQNTDTLNEAIRKVELKADSAYNDCNNIQHSIVADNLIRTNPNPNTIITIARVGGVDFTLENTGLLRLNGLGEETENGFELGTSILFTQGYYDYTRFVNTMVSVHSKSANNFSIRIVVKGYIKTDSSVTETENVLDAVFSKDNNYRKYFRLNLSKGNIYKVFVFPVVGERYNNQNLTIMMTHAQIDCEFQPYNLSRYSFREDIDRMLGVVDNLDKSSIGLGNVDNTSDMDKPISTATQTELDKKANKTFIDSVESETRVVTVPDGALSAAVEKISGKTVKSKNILPIYKGVEYPYHTAFTVGSIDITDGVVVTVSDNKYIINGTAIRDNGTIYLTSNLITETNVKKGGTYTITITTTKSILAICRKIAVSTDSIIETPLSTRLTANEKYSFTFDVPTEDDVDLRFILRPVIADGEFKNDIITVQIEEGSESTDYEPYFEGLRSAPVEKIVSTNIIKSDFGELTKAHGRYGYDFDNLKSGQYEITITNSSSKAISIDTYHNGAFSNKIKLVNANETKTEVFNVTDGDSIVVICSFKAGENPVSFISVSFGGKPFVKEISLANIVKDLPDYGCSAGDVYNWIDFENMVYHHNVGSIDLGTVSIWRYSESERRFNTNIPNIKTSLRQTQLICDKYESKSNNETYDTNWNMVVYTGSDAAGSFFIHDHNYTDTNTLIEALKGIILNYELATPEEIPLTPFFRPFTVEAGGTIEFVNEHSLDIPNTVKYKKEVK